MTWTILPSSAFGDHRRAWDTLNAAGPNSPVLDSALPFHALREFGMGKERLALYGNLASPQAMAIIQHRRFGVWDTFQPSQAPLGFWMNAASKPLVELLSELARALPGFVLKLGLTQQDPDIFPRPVDDLHISTLDYIDTARVRVEGSFEHYWSARGKNLRHNLNKQRNKLAKERIDIRLEVLSASADMARAVRDYGELESAGWKAEGGTAIHADNPQGRFYTVLLEDFAQRRQASVYRYFYNERLVATDLCVAQGGIFVILKTTYDEQEKATSPALLMRQEMFDRLFREQQTDRIEFYGKVMDWHTKWSDDIRTLYHINVHRRFAAPLLRWLSPELVQKNRS